MMKGVGYALLVSRRREHRGIFEGGEQRRRARRCVTSQGSNLE
ncbi:hypothetical protein NFJ02_04g116650 [Pycnococcus provasolii]